MKRKRHYNEAQNIKLARQLIEKELRGDESSREEEEEEEDEEMTDAAGSERMSPELGEHFLLQARAVGPDGFCSWWHPPGKGAGETVGDGGGGFPGFLVLAEACWVPPVRAPLLVCVAFGAAGPGVGILAVS